MKKILLLLLSAPLALSLSSCIEDAEVTASMTEDQKNEIAANDPEKLFSAAVAGMYTDLQSYYNTDVNHNYFGQKSFDYLTSLMGNDMVMTGRFAMSLFHYLLDYWGQSYVPTSNRWREYYRVIDNSNQILKTIDPETTDAVELKYRAIALGFRGYAYLQLTYLYQYSYYVGAEGTKWGKGQTYDHSKELCVPIITEANMGEQMPRATVKEVYDQILGDLTTAYGIFDKLGMMKTPSPTDMDGCVVAMHLARANMVIHEWDEAIKYAQKVIDNFPVLQGEDQILQGFSSITLPDVVFGCETTSDNTTVYASFFSQMDSYSDGYAGIGVWRLGFKPLVDRIDDNDIRLNWFLTNRSIGENGLVKVFPSNGAFFYQSVKFIGAGRDAILAAEGNAEGWELGDYIYLRSEEAYLMKIEALAHKGATNAAEELTKFMETRQPGYQCTLTDKADLLEEINFQKRVEFWGEGIEYLDNRRLNIPVDRRDETWGADNNNHLSGAKLFANQEDRCMRYQLPISEIENNQMITPADQN